MRQARMNPAEGARLTRLGDGVWSADRELLLPAAVPLPVRMVVIADTRGRLLCYSPVRMDDGTVEALAGLGTVDLLAVPNRFHTGFVDDARRAYPDARVVGPARVSAAGPLDELAGDGSLDGFADYHVLAGSAGFSELALYHDRSETLVLCDLMINVSAAGRRLAWALRLAGAWGGPRRPAAQRMLYARRGAALTAFYHWAMARPFRQICVAHGGVVRERAREVFYRLFRPG